MPYISNTITNLIEGVSQQSPAARRDTQSEHELNTVQSAVEGLGKRPPAELIGAIGTHTVVPFVHWISRDAVSRYSVLIGSATLKVYDLLTAAEVASIALDNTHPLYTSATDKRSSYVALTSADTTFIALRSKVVAERSATQAARPFEAVINVKAGAFARFYRVLINGTEYTNFETPDGGGAAQAPYAATDIIADRLVTASSIPGSSGGATGPGLDTLSGYTVTRVGSVIYLSHPTVDFTISTDDGQGNVAMTAIKGSVNKFSDLPKDVPTDGFTIQITGDDQNPYDDYFVRWDADSRTWIETIAPGAKLGLDRATMPYVLQRSSGGTWTLAQGAYLDRGAGSDVSNEKPPFVGLTITAITENDGRLGIGSGEEMYWSKVNDVYRFYRETVTQYLPDEPFGLTCTGDETVSSIRAVVKSNERLIIVSDTRQHVISSDNVFGYGSARAIPTTDVQVEPLTPAAVVASDLLLATSSGNWAGISQLFVDSISGSAEVEDITEAVPSYIPAGLHSFTVSKARRMAFLVSFNDASSVYVWTYLLKGRERVQSAFSKWSYNCDMVVSCRVISNTLYLVLKRGQVYYLLSTDLSARPTDPNQVFKHLFDWRVANTACTVTYSSFTGRSTIVHPVASLTAIQVASRGLDTEAPGELADVYSTSPGTIVVAGDWRTRPFYAGVNYVFEYEFSKLYPRDSATGAARQDSRLQVAHLFVDYTRTGYFQATVQPQGERAARVKTFEGRIFDSPVNITDEVALDEGRFSIPVMSNGATVKVTLRNDSFLPCYFLQASWEGTYNPKARRIR